MYMGYALENYFKPHCYIKIHMREARIYVRGGLKLLDTRHTYVYRLTILIKPNITQGSI